MEGVDYDKNYMVSSLGFPRDLENLRPAHLKLIKEP